MLTIAQRIPLTPGHLAVTVVQSDIVHVTVNGIDGSTRRCEPHSESSSSEDQELEEERRIVREQLSKLPTPKVRLPCDNVHVVWLLSCCFCSVKNLGPKNYLFLRTLQLNGNFEGQYLWRGK